ncbi:hypothetical protein E0Z10_g9213 [Xylaria hypoxylon]|uniref:Protein kinase domain-containing protein n=1 Tax=Xylaria hypoxylon TaxID=37992 RepID=A0A4Z0YK03_9PEZI|nr:hypothetical protein E0Z10_g9213 [Xylaria hypoxylon]
MAPLFATFEQELQGRNEIWRRYRTAGTVANDNYRGRRAVINLFRQNGFPIPLPLPGPSMFFMNHKIRLKRYNLPVNSGAGIDLAADIDADDQPDAANAQRRYRQLKAYFGESRYVMQKILGFGGNGLATHFRDRGPSSTDDPGKDFVIKIALSGWQNWALTEEMVFGKSKKVKGSAHCVQMFEPEDIGKHEEREVRLLHGNDSSTDDDSSGNESSNAVEVRRRHRIPKRRTRSQQHWIRKKEKRRIRKRQIDVEWQLQERKRKNYIILEYLQHGSLATLIFKHVAIWKEYGELVMVPNRVLWGFWLCSMEYPPRKFHPLRKQPEAPPGSFVSSVQAKANKMLLECRRLGIKLFDPEKHAKMEAEYKQLDGDLIENIPNPEGHRSQNWKRNRRQNLVHGDLDPTNILVGGFELDQEALLHWEKKRKADSPSASKKKKKDLGEYYMLHRMINKHGEHPPETFGPEWEKVEGGKDGDYLANSRTCGYFSNKTNIWSSALTMWELITKCKGPTPPHPQPPYSEADRYKPYNDEGQTDLDEIFNVPTYADFKISYCSLLLDPTVNSFIGVDETLRKTIFKCQELLREAEENIQSDFRGETDADIRDWIQYWFFDADVARAKPEPPRPENQNPIVQDLARRNAIALEEASDDTRYRLRIRYNADFPDGADRIPNAGTGLRCGLMALADSLQHQLGLQPIINGVVYNVNALPTADDLLEIFKRLRDDGHFNLAVGEADDEQLGEGNNFNVSQIGAVLDAWGQTEGLELELAYFLFARGVMPVGSAYNNPKLIWIHNDNAEDLLAQSLKAAAQLQPNKVKKKGDDVQIISHFEGLRPKPPPPVDGDDDDLPDYLSDY